MINSLHIATTVLAAGPKGAGPTVALQGFGLALAIIALVACAGFAWSFIRQRATAARLAALHVDLSELKQENKGLQDKERKQKKKLDARHDEITELRRDVTAQRKKTHAAQEEGKKLRDEMRQLQRTAEAALKARPAFEERPRPKNEPAETPAPAPTAAAERPEKEETPVSGSAPASTERDTAPKPDRELEELKGRARKLQAENEDLQKKLNVERDTVRNQKTELKRLRKRAEQLRRIDIITKSRMELLQDKLRTIGREYYNTVSELAVFKGEVKPLPKEAFTVAAEPPMDAETEAALAGEGLDDAYNETDDDAEAADVMTEDVAEGASNDMLSGMTGEVEEAETEDLQPADALDSGENARPIEPPVENENENENEDASDQAPEPTSIAAEVEPDAETKPNADTDSNTTNQDGLLRAATAS